MICVLLLDMVWNVLAFVSSVGPPVGDISMVVPSIAMGSLTSGGKVELFPLDESGSKSAAETFVESDPV